MAQMALSDSSLQRVRTLANQWQATHGRAATPDVMRALMEAEIGNASNRGMESAQFDRALSLDKENQRRYDEGVALQSEQQKKTDRAATVKGGIDTAMSGASLYLAATKGTAALTGGAAASTGAAGTTGAALGSSTVGTGAASVSSLGTMGGTGAGTLGTGASSGAVSGSIGATGTGMSGGTAAGGGSAAGGMASAGVAAVIIAAVLADRKIAGNNTRYATTGDRVKEAGRGVFAGGLTSGQLASLESKGIKMPGEAIFGDKFKDSNYNPVHVTGDALGSIYDHVGDMGLGDFADSVGSVICTELAAQGMMDAHLAAAASRYRKKHIPAEEYAGYIMWASPVVRAMRRNRKFARVVKTLWTPICVAMASGVSDHFQSGPLPRAGLYAIRKITKAIYIGNKFLNLCRSVEVAHV